MKDDLAQMAKAEHRSIIGLLRVMVQIYKKLTPVERAHILERGENEQHATPGT
jgi:hypothetical protein